MYVLYNFYCTLADECNIDFPSSSSTVKVNCVPQRSSIISLIKSSSMEYTQQNISVVSQPNSSVTIVSDSHTTFSCSPVTTFSVVECLTTSSSVVTSISEQAIAGKCILQYIVDYFLVSFTYNYNYHIQCLLIFRYITYIIQTKLVAY